MTGLIYGAIYCLSCVGIYKLLSKVTPSNTIKIIGSIIFSMLPVTIIFLGFHQQDIEGNPVSISVSNDAQKAIKKTIKDPEPKQIETLLTIEIEEKSDGLIIIGETNLPEGTKLGISVKGSNYHAQDYKVFVESGVYESAKFSNRGLPLIGRYDIEIMLYENKNWQTSRVLKELKRNKVTGMINKKAVFRKQVTLGDSTSSTIISKIQSRDRNENKKYSSLNSKAHQLLRQGQNMEKYRNSSGMKQCISIMHQTLPKVKILRNEIDSLPKSNKVIMLGIGAAYLDSCVTCMSSAMESCGEAKIILNQEN